MLTASRFMTGPAVTISFKGAHFPKDVILHAVFVYLRYSVSYRDLEEILVERGVVTSFFAEEPWLQDKYGAAFEAYRDSTRRFL